MTYRANNIESVRVVLGMAVLEPAMCDALALLWEGPLDPSKLEAIECTLRAFLLCSALSLSQFQGPDTGVLEGSRLEIEYEQPFGDQFLDYEFIDPTIETPRIAIDYKESGFLHSFVHKEIVRQALNVLPGWIKHAGHARKFLHCWYDGQPLNECEKSARDYELEPIDYDYDIINNPETDIGLMLDASFEHAKYLVECHRAGLQIYGNAPIHKVCQIHIFTLWPNELVKSLDEDYKKTLREIRGPQIAFDIPPLTMLLLSRANSRYRIPETLRDLREEYERPRQKLWKMLLEMWEADKLSDQIKILRTLKKAADNIFAAAFPEKKDILSIGLGLSQMTPSGLASALSILKEHDKPNASVAAVSFAAKLAKDMRESLLNSPKILRHHFSKAELQSFGV